MTHVVIVNGVVVSEAIDEPAARAIAESAVAQGGGSARVAKICGECRAVPTPTWESQGDPA